MHRRSRSSSTRSRAGPKEPRTLTRDFTRADLPALDDLQPEGWRAIAPAYAFYLEAPFCRPLAVDIDGRIAGIGAYTCFGATAWIGHIITHREMRRRGVGTAVMRELLARLDALGTRTVSLIATSDGEPLYAGLGFEVEMRYVFLRRDAEQPRPGADAPSRDVAAVERQGSAEGDRTTCVRAALDSDWPAIVQIDREVSGEERAPVLDLHGLGAQVAERSGTIVGFYLPALGEGLVAALDDDAGCALLARRTEASDAIVVPERNETALSWLRDHGFEERRRGARMVRGPLTAWRPQRLYSRIAGNLG